jgi:hypothetical protein
METTLQTNHIDQLTNEQLDEFRQRFSGPVIEKNDSSYDTDRQLWNKMIDKKPGLIARCKGVSDVIQAVRFARENKLPVSVRGGGHNVAGNALIDDGMVIDLSEMRTVWVDTGKKTAKIQGGATWADVDRETQPFGLACPGGVVSETGVGGLTLGGGYSHFRRKAGMSIDNLIGADMVLADGRYVHVNANENPDLFWAIRGGGGNFGIATSFDFKLYDLGPEVMFAACMYPRAEAEKVLKFWADYTRDLPDEITTDCLNWAIPEHEAFPVELHNQPVTALAGMYAGPPEEGKKALQPLREVTKPLLDLSNVYPYTAVQQLFDPFLQKQALYSYWKCIYLDDLTEEVRQKIISRVNESPSPQSLLSIRYLDGAISRVPEQATAFGDRSARFLLSIDTMWTDPASNESNKQWTRDFWQEMRQFSDGQVYFNFNSDMSGSSNLLKESYGRNYDRLVDVKTKYDPDNFFRMNVNIQPE